MSQRKLTAREIKVMQDAFKADYEVGDIRLRKGEYQHSLAEALASFQLELQFPNVKDIIRRLYGEEQTEDIQFVRKIQTILKKMEKSNVVKILPKKRPWELQRYALSSFRFQDSDKNLVTFATDQQIERTRDLMDSILGEQRTVEDKIHNARIKISILVFIVAASYATILWDFMQPAINPVIFVPVFFIAIVCSLMLGKMLSHE